MDREKPVYALINIANGIQSEPMATTDFRRAQKEYQSAYRSCGITPRVYVDGRRLTIVEGDKLFGLDGASKWRGKCCTEPEEEKKPKYIDQHKSIAIKKARKTHKRPPRGGQL